MRFAKRSPILRKLKNLVLRLLEQKHLWVPHKAEAINFLDEEFKKYTQPSQTAFDELASLVETDPQLIIDCFREALSMETFTTFATLVRPGEKKLRSEIDFIAVFWEVSCLFAFPAYLLSRRRIPLQSLGETKAVLKHFGGFGIASKDIENMRRIRNAKSHKFTIRNGRLVGKTDNSPIAIDRTEIAMLSDKLGDLFQWYFRFVLGQTFCIPKFGLLLIYTICEKASRDIDDLNAYIEELQTEFLPQGALERNRKQGWKDRLRKVGQKIKVKIPIPLLQKDQVSEFLLEHRGLLIEKAKDHAKDVASELRNLSDQLTNPKDKEMFLWLSKYVIAFGEVMDALTSQPSKS